MSKLIDFICAQLDAEECLARRLAERYRVRNEDRADDGEQYWPTPSVGAALRTASDPDIAAGLELIQMYSPARVLAEVAAKRAIVNWCWRMDPMPGMGGILAGEARKILQLLAQPYAGREGWRDEWRVE